MLTGPAASPEGGLGSGRWRDASGAIDLTNVWTSVIEFNLFLPRRLVLALGLVTLDELPTLVADPERVAAIGEAARQLAADKTPVTFRSTERVSKGGQVFIGIDLDSVKIKA